MDNFDIAENKDNNNIVSPQQIVAISAVFARAIKQMNLAEYKTFIYALTQIKWTEPDNSNVVLLDKKTLAGIIGISSDRNNLSINLRRAIENLPIHSGIIISTKDKRRWQSGVLITCIDSTLRNQVKVTFNEYYMPLFKGLTEKEIKQINDALNKNPEIAKAAKDI